MSQPSSPQSVIVTGGTRGIGRGIADGFAQAGYHVVTLARSQPEPGFPHAFVPVDVSRLDSVREAVDRALQNAPPLGVFVNNAGLSSWRSLEHVDSDFVDQLLDINLKGTLWGCKVAAERLHTGGVILNVASLAGKRGSKNNSVYCAAKFGVVGVTQALSKELGAKGIRVNSVCPVYVVTEGLVAELKGDHPEIGNREPREFLTSWASTNAALGRLPRADEVASACLFLASPAASAITGQNINVDCGVLPQ